MNVIYFYNPLFRGIDKSTIPVIIIRPCWFARRLFWGVSKNPFFSLLCELAGIFYKLI